MKLKNEIGTISLSSGVFTAIAGMAATNCFGVKGMAHKSVTDGLVHLLKKESMTKGVKVTPVSENEIRVGLHIIVEHGVNIPAVCDSIMSEVRYHLERLTGVTVTAVDVYVDSIMREYRPER